MYFLTPEGTFYSGDSYILLNTYKKKPDSPALAWDVHFWLGKFTTQDEAGTAAYKTVELDDLLGGAPVQHREVQGHESDLFLGYFKNQIKILDGGVDSGFKVSDLFTITDHIGDSLEELKAFTVLIIANPCLAC
jgi:hypothetical protein